MSYTLSTEPYSDTSRVMSELAVLADRAVVSMGWNSANIGGIVPAWKAGNLLVITDRKDGLLLGTALVLRTPSAIHDSDALVLLAVPAEGRESALLNFTKMAAKAHGARGLSMSVDINAPLPFIDLMGQQGFRAKAMTYGVRL
jgi:hypothetical protein